MSKRFTTAAVTSLIMMSGAAYAQTANQIYIDQVGTTQAGSNLTLTGIQIGAGNRIAGSNLGSLVALDGSSPMGVLQGDSQTIVLEQFGQGNTTLIDLIGTNVTAELLAVGDNNLLRIECADVAEACGSASILIDVTGNDNVIDFFVGGQGPTSSVSLNVLMQGSDNRMVSIEDVRTNSVSAITDTYQGPAIYIPMNLSFVLISDDLVDSAAAMAVSLLDRANNGAIDPSSSNVAGLDSTSYALHNTIDGDNHEIYIGVYGDSNLMTTEIAGAGHRYDLAVDGDFSSISTRIEGDNSTVQISLNGDNAEVGIISLDAGAALSR